MSVIKIVRSPELPIERMVYVKDELKVSITEFKNTGTVVACVESRSMEYCVGTVGEHVKINLDPSGDRYLMISWQKPLRLMVRCVTENVLWEKCEEYPVDSPRGRTLLMELAEIAEFLLDRASTAKAHEVDKDGAVPGTGN